MAKSAYQAVSLPPIKAVSTTPPKPAKQIAQAPMKVQKLTLKPQRTLMKPAKGDAGLIKRAKTGA